MIRQILLSIAAFGIIAMCSAGCTVQNSVSTSAAPQARWGHFFARLEASKHLAASWNEVAADAQAAGIGDDLSLGDWTLLLRVAKKHGMISRCTLQLHPLVKKREYFDAMAEAFKDSDLFTRGRLYDLMVKQYPDDPRTPRYGLQLFLGLQNGHPPKGIDSDQLKDAVSNLLEEQWSLPDPLDSITPEVCASLLRQQSKWRFDKSDNTWHVESAPPR